MKRIFFLHLAILLHFTPILPIEFIRLGSSYGGWTIPKTLLNKNSICYLAGVGEDITFDLSLIKKFGCNVYSIDPTPRAIKHINNLKNIVKNQKEPYLYRSHNSTLSINKSEVEKLNFTPVGLWSKNTSLKFYEPQNPLHVSHSVVNLQQTSNYFEAKCWTLKALMKKLKHTHIDLLKLDIEGAEYEVVRSLIRDNIDIKCIVLEFDEWAGPNTVKIKTEQEKAKRLSKTLNTINLLKNKGYQVYFINSYLEVLFIKY